MTILSILKWIVSNKTLILIAYALLMTLALVFGIGMYRNLLAEKNRYKNNQQALTTELVTYKTENGKNAAKIQQLELTKKEFEKICAEQAEIVEDMGIKLKRLQSVSSTGSKTIVEIETILRDTIVQTIVDSISVYEKARHFAWNDNWNKIEGTIVGDKVKCDYEGFDTLTVAAVRVPKKFLFFKWGCKYVEVHIAHQNPASEITYNRTVQIKKK